MITDEAQEYKTPNTKISHAIKALDPAFRLASTGTPVENRLLDLWNLMDALQPALLGTAKQFNSAYEVGEEDKAEARIEALRTKLLLGKPNAFVVRRSKSELPDLPKKEIVPVLCDMSDFEVAMHTDLLKMLPEHRRQGTHFRILHQLVQLYQHPQLLKREQGYLDPARLIAESAKLRRVIEILHNVRQRREKAVIFARFVNMQQILAVVLSAEFDLHVQIINGSPSQQQGIRSSGSTGRARSARKQILDNFKSKPGFNVIVLSPFVAGIGLTITEANHVIHYGRWWNPAVEAQATDRVYRIGQEKDVYVYLPILKDGAGRITSSFDERLHLLLERKAKLAHDFLRPIGNEGGCGNELCDSLMEDQAGQGATLEPLAMDDVDRLSPLDFEAMASTSVTGGTLELDGNASFTSPTITVGGNGTIYAPDATATIVTTALNNSGVLDYESGGDGVLALGNATYTGVAGSRLVADAHLGGTGSTSDVLSVATTAGTSSIVVANVNGGYGGYVPMSQAIVLVSTGTGGNCATFTLDPASGGGHAFYTNAYGPAGVIQDGALRLRPDQPGQPDGADQLRRTASLPVGRTGHGGPEHLVRHRALAGPPGRPARRHDAPSPIRPAISPACG